MVEPPPAELVAPAAVVKAPVNVQAPVEKAVPGQGQGEIKWDWDWWWSGSAADGPFANGRFWGSEFSFEDSLF
jgi:hypothetical protein